MARDRRNAGINTVGHPCDSITSRLGKLYRVVDLSIRLTLIDHVLRLASRGTATNRADFRDCDALPAPRPRGRDAVPVRTIQALPTSCLPEE
jgi:hypothetical protein